LFYLKVRITTFKPPIKPCDLSFVVLAFVYFRTMYIPAYPSFIGWSLMPIELAFVYFRTMYIPAYPSFIGWSLMPIELT